MLKKRKKCIRSNSGGGGLLARNDGRHNKNRKSNEENHKKAFIVRLCILLQFSENHKNYFFVITFNYANGKLNISILFLPFSSYLNWRRESFPNETIESNSYRLSVQVGFAFETPRAPVLYRRRYTIRSLLPFVLQKCMTSVLVLKYCAYEMICALGNIRQI